MGQYSDLVEKQRTLLEVEKWRKGVKQIMMVASPDKKLWTTTYNDEAQLFEKVIMIEPRLITIRNSNSHSYMPFYDISTLD